MPRKVRKTRNTKKLVEMFLEDGAPFIRIIQLLQQLRDKGWAEQDIADALINYVISGKHLTIRQITLALDRARSGI